MNAQVKENGVVKVKDKGWVRDRSSKTTFEQ